MTTRAGGDNFHCTVEPSPGHNRCQGLSQGFPKGGFVRGEISILGVVRAPLVATIRIQ